MVLIPQGNDGRDFGRQWFWKSLSVDIQEPEERGLKSRNDFFTGTRARKEWEDLGSGSQMTLLVLKSCGDTSSLDQRKRSKDKWKCRTI